MADDGRGKRLKSSEDGIVIALRERIAELESEIAQLRGGQEVAELRGRNAELESENEQLRQPGRRLEEVGHEVLPAVVEVVVTVDLSRFDTGLVSHISSFLDTARELLNLALTCKPFGWRQPTSTLNWSLVEEVARQAICSRATDAEMGCLPRYVSGTTTWLLILHRHEHLLDFDVLLGGHIEHRNGDKTTVCGSGDGDDYIIHDGAAVSSSYVMRSGAHYAEFQIGGEPCIGIVRPMPGLDTGAYREEFDFFEDRFYSDIREQKSDEWGNGGVHACEYWSFNGSMNWTYWNDEESFNVDWEGMEGCDDGDTVGMLLNLDEGTLTSYKNNRRLGVMKDGLSGPYCWYARLNYDDHQVTIRRGKPPRT